MGADDGLKRKSNYEIQFIKGLLIKDSILGNYFEYSNKKNNMKIICIEKLLNNRQELLKKIEESKKKILNKNENLLNILDYSVDVQNNWCSTFYLLKLFYEYPNKSLKEEINSRKSKNQNFNMKELTHLLYNITNAGVHLQENNIKHNDICPSLIYYTKNNNFKLLLNDKNVNNPERYQLEKMLRKDNFYLSPNLYIALKKRFLDNIKHKKVKSDIFAFGLVVLETGLLRSVRNIYDNSCINKKILESYLKEFEEKYDNNPLLYSSLRKILEFNEEERPDFISLKEVIPDYDMIKEYFKKLENGELEDDNQVDDDEEEVEQDLFKGRQNQDLFKGRQNKDLFQGRQNQEVKVMNSNSRLSQNLNFQKNTKPQNNTNYFANKVIKAPEDNFFDVFDDQKQSIGGKKTNADIYSENKSHGTKNQTIDNFFDQNSFIPPENKNIYSTNLYSNLSKKYNNNQQNTNTIYNKNYQNIQNPKTIYNKNKYQKKASLKNYDNKKSNNTNINKLYNNYNKNEKSHFLKEGRIDNLKVNENYYYKQPKPSYGYSNQNSRPISMNSNYNSHSRPVSQKMNNFNLQPMNGFRRPESSYQQSYNGYNNHQKQNPYSRYK